MVGSRTLTALAGLVFGVAVSVAAWVVLETLLLFLFLPFVPFLFGWGGGDDDETMTHPRSQSQPESVRCCPDCSFRTTDPEYEFCPRDGRRLRDGRREP